MEEEEIGNDGLFSAALKRAVSNSVNDLRREAVYAARQDATDVNQFGGTGTTFEDAGMAALAAPFRLVKNAATETFDSIGRVGRDLAGGAAAVVANMPSLATKQASVDDLITTIDFFSTLGVGGLTGAKYIANKSGTMLLPRQIKKATKLNPSQMEIRDRILEGKGAVVNQYLDNTDEVVRRINSLVDKKTTREEILKMVESIKEIPTHVGTTTPMGRSMHGTRGMYEARFVDLRKDGSTRANTKAVEPAVTINPNTNLDDIADTALHEYTHAFDNANTTYEGRFKWYDSNDGDVEWEADIPIISDQINSANPSLLPSVDDIEKSLRKSFDNPRNISPELARTMFSVIRKDAEYLGEPVEQFARINELRHIINQPSNLYRQVSKEDVFEALSRIKKNNSREDLGKYLESMSPEKITELINKLPAVAGAAAVARAQGRGEE